MRATVTLCKLPNKTGPTFALLIGHVLLHCTYYWVCVWQTGTFDSLRTALLLKGKTLFEELQFLQRKHKFYVHTPPSKKNPPNSKFKHDTVILYSCLNFIHTLTFLCLELGYKRSRQFEGFSSQIALSVAWCRWLVWCRCYKYELLTYSRYDPKLCLSDLSSIYSEWLW